MTRKAKPTITDALGRTRSATRASRGKIRTLPSGRLQASYVGPDEKRYNAPATFDNRTDAEAWLTNVYSEISREVWLSPADKAAERERSARTLGDYAETWLKDRTNARGDHLRPRTRDEYKRLLRTPDPDDETDTGGPLAELVTLPLRDLTAAKVRTWRSAQLETGKKTQTSRAYGLLSAILATAAADKLIDENPCRIKGGQSTHTGREVKPPTDDELAKILATIKPRFRALVAIAAGGGLRYGEATALRAKDVTVEKSGAVRLNVGRGVVRTADGITPGETKSAAGVRTVGIFGDDAAIIAEHVRGIIGDALLFPATDGRSFLPQSSFWKHWNLARTAAGRPEMPFHALRHYAGTRYAQAGATPRETMARLGHSSMGAAMRYQHAGNRDDELAARMARRSTGTED